MHNEAIDVSVQSCYVNKRKHQDSPI